MVLNTITANAAFLFRKLFSIEIGDLNGKQAHVSYKAGGRASRATQYSAFLIAKYNATQDVLRACVCVRARVKTRASPSVCVSFARTNV